MSNQQNIKPNNSHELEFAYRSTYNSKNIRDERRKIIKSNQLSTMNHNYAPFLSLYILHQRIIKKKEYYIRRFYSSFFFWYPLNSNLEVPQIHGRGRKRINFVRRGCNNGFTSRANTLRTESSGARNLEKLNISMCSGRHLCSKFTQLDITLTRQMFGIIKLLPREQPQWIMYRVEYVRITSISNTFLMPILKNLIMLITNRKFETEDWEFKLILKQRYIPLRSRWNFFCLNFFFFYSFIFYFSLKYISNIWRV